MGLFGPPNVEKMKAKHDVKGLIKALGYKKDAEVRRNAALALGELGDPRAVQPLIAALGDEKWPVRAAAAHALGQIGDARAVEPLISVFGDKDWPVRRAAADALGQIGDARAVQPLIAALKDEQDEVRRAAARALGQIGDPCAVKPLIAALRDEDEYVRKAAADALGQIGDACAVEPLIALLEDRDSSVRKAAAEVLRQIGDPNVVEPLVAGILPTWVTEEGVTVFAFKAFTPAFEALMVFGTRVGVRSGDIEDKIRQEAQCPDAVVILLEPDEWDAPSVASPSLNDIAAAYPLVLARASKALVRRYGIRCTPQSLEAMGVGAMPHPTHVLFLFKVPGRPGSGGSS